MSIFEENRRGLPTDFYCINKVMSTRLQINRKNQKRNSKKTENENNQDIELIHNCIAWA
jgi:hypothetical protein